jgi:ribose 5-phosphate isomerase B
MPEAPEVKKVIAIGADHAGFEYKTIIIDLLQSKRLPVKDFGTYSPDSVDYPDFAHPVASAVERGKAALGILVCGSGNGVAITANKHRGIRAAIAWTEELAQLARQHNNANILCLPSRFISTIVAEEIVTAFLNTHFEGGRHQKRVDKIASV